MFVVHGLVDQESDVSGQDRILTEPGEGDRLPRGYSVGALVVGNGVALLMAVLIVVR